MSILSAGGHLEQFAATRFGDPVPALQVEVQPLHGGLESRCVRWVTARAAGADGHEQSFVAKQLAGHSRREARIYKALMNSAARGLTPALLGERPGANGALELYLEAVSGQEGWAWHEPSYVESVLKALALLHGIALSDSLASQVNDWNYDAELAERAELLVAFLENHRADLRQLGAIVRLRMLRRLVAALPRLRRALIAESVFPAAVIHGDMHTRNVVLRRLRPASPVLLDWARARIGSPLEDVSSWLQSLAFWEPGVRRQHDTLVRAYFGWRGARWPPSPKVRGQYWVGAASNCLAGSLQYHLEVALGAQTTPARTAALAAVGDQLRILRRAAAQV